MAVDLKKTLAVVAGGLIVVALAYVLLSTPVVRIYPDAVSIEGNESVPIVVTFGGLVDIAESKVSSPYIRTTIISTEGNRWNLKFDDNNNLPNGEYDVIISVRAPYVPFFQDNTVVVHVNRAGVNDVSDAELIGIAQSDSNWTDIDTAYGIFFNNPTCKNGTGIISVGYHYEKIDNITQMVYNLTCLNETVILIPQ